MKMRIILLCVALAAHCLHEIEACNCTARNDSEVYCSSQFVAQITIESAKLHNESTGGKIHKNYEQYEYGVTFDKVYKKDKHFGATEKNKKVYSIAVEEGCGVDITVEKDKKKNQYLIGGYIAKDKAYIHKCSWIKPLEKVDQELKNKLDKNQFEEDCPEQVVKKENEKRKKWRKETFGSYNRTEVDQNKTKAHTKPPKRQFRL